MRRAEVPTRICIARAEPIVSSVSWSEYWRPCRDFFEADRRLVHRIVQLKKAWLALLGQPGRKSRQRAFCWRYFALLHQALNIARTEPSRGDPIAQQRAAEAAARERARAAEEQARAQREHLTRIAAREAAVWSEVEALIQTRNPKSYDQAVVLLADLCDAAALVTKSGDFKARLRELRETHASKPSLIRRLDVAELR